MKSVFNIQIDILALISGSMIIFIMLIISASVFMRYVFGLSFAWQTEISEYLIYYMVIFAVPWVLKRNEHIIIDLLIDNVSTRLKNRLYLLANMLGLLLFITLLYYSIYTIYINYTEGLTTLNVLRFPRYMFTIAMPVMSIMCVIIYIDRLIYMFKLKKENSGLGEGETLKQLNKKVLYD